MQKLSSATSSVAVNALATQTVSWCTADEKNSLRALNTVPATPTIATTTTTKSTTAAATSSQAVSG